MSWTGGQYSVHRVVLGFVTGGLAVAALIATDGVTATSALGAGAVLASGALVLGMGDRWASLLLLAAGVAGWRELLGSGELAIALGGLLILHLATPGAPFGSWAARGRVDPAGTWVMPGVLEQPTRWLAMAFHLVLGVNGVRALSGGAPWIPWRNWTPLGSGDSAAMIAGWIVVVSVCAIAVLLCAPPLRKVVWLVGGPFWLAALVLTEATAVSAVALALHMRWFQPSWFPATEGRLVVFFDGKCGMCHRWVRTVLAEDPSGVVQFAPLQSPAFEQRFSGEQRAAWPDSIVVAQGDETWVRSAAALRVMGAVGGLWRLCAAVLGWVPRPISDLVYDGVARIRRRLFKTPDESCPITPPHLQDRFLDR